MESKQAILKAVAQYQPTPVALPEPVTFGIRYDDPFSQFSTVLEAVGGRAVRLPNIATAHAEITKLDVAANAQRIYSGLPDAIPSNVELATVDDPHSLNDLDLAVLPGDLAVAENAAVWVTDEDLRHRVVPYIAQHLILIVASSTLVHNLHEAYQQLTFDRRQYGVFISGPSKTADIEQSLVIGAQGPRSLHVLLVDEK